MFFKNSQLWFYFKSVSLIKILIVIGHCFFIGLVLSSNSSVSLLIFLEGLAFFGYMSMVWKDYKKCGCYVPMLFISSVIPFMLIMWGLLFSKELIVVIGFLFKISFFPFLWWFPYMSSFLNFFLFFVFGVMKKAFPIFMLLMKQIMSFKVLFFVCIFSIGMSLMYLSMSQNDLKVFFAWSSNVKYGWMILALSQSWMKGSLYFLFYILVFSILLIFLKDSNLFLDQFKKSNFGEVMLVMVVLITFLGLPPFFGFLYKYALLNSVVSFDYLKVSFFILVVLILLMTLKSFLYMNLLFKFNLLKAFFLEMNPFFVILLIGGYLLVSISYVSF